MILPIHYIQFVTTHKIVTITQTTLRDKNGTVGEENTLPVNLLLADTIV
ncbi:MAG: hypothetical protein IPP29_07585 [Bacteroidetes bacterium]|nr:hypothetical protein [Bacteroidota bacterium]